jgi:low temperature requirement protein LtrA
LSEPLVEREQRVTSPELFFDLVFAFGFTQVTTVLSDSPTWHGLVHALLVLATLWWAWAAYAWLTNTANPEDGRVWGPMVIAAAAMFVAALAIPDAFGAHGVVFGIAFLVVVLMQLMLYAFAARGDRDLLGAVLRIAPPFVAGAALVVGAGFAAGGLKPALWMVGLAVGLFGPLYVPLQGWRVEPAHFVERHGLIVIIAIGESLVAIGYGARQTALTASVIVAATLGLLVAASFWLAYFDFFTIRAKQLLTQRSGTSRTAFARTVSYLHLPMIAGIVLFAFAMRTTLAHVGHTLAIVPAIGLCVGPALYLAAWVALRARISGKVIGGRFAAAIACAAILPIARTAPAIASLSLIAAVWGALHVYELVWWRDARAQTRGHTGLDVVTAETGESE